jgi:hypothetical protein
LRPLRRVEGRPNDLLDRDLEASDDAGVAALRDELGIGIARCHPRISLLRVGDDVREATGTDREDPSGLFTGVAERVEAGAPLGTEDEVPLAISSSPC